MNPYPFLLLLLLPFLSCKKDAAPVKFEMAYLNQEIEIQAGLNLYETHRYRIFDIPTDIETYLTTYGLEKEDVLSILPSQCRLINFSGNARYNFLFEVSVRIFSRDNPDRSFEIFYDDAVPENTGTALRLIPNENDIKEFLLKDKFSIEVILKRLRDVPSEFIRTRIELRFDAR